MPNSDSVKQVIDEYQSWAFVSGVQNSVLDVSSASDESAQHRNMTFLSNTFVFQIKGSHDYLATDEDQYVYENVELKDLEDPAVMRVPLKDESKIWRPVTLMKCV